MNKIFKLITIIFLLFIYLYKNNIIQFLKLYNESGKTKIIFSFWEPRDRMPGYLTLCIKTWKKFLPNYQINILDFNSAKTYLGESLFKNIYCEDLYLHTQVDAIRVALLKKYGGIWMDADTIVLNGDIFNKLKDFELIMFGSETSKIQNIGFIYASDNSIVIKEWLEEIIKKIKLYKKIKIESKNNSVIKNYLMKFNVGNHIVDNILKKNKGKQFLRIDRSVINPFPEHEIIKNNSLKAFGKYRALYFQKGDPQLILRKSKSIGDKLFNLNIGAVKLVKN